MSRQNQRYQSPFGANRKQGDGLNSQNFLSSAGVQAALSGLGYGVNGRTLNGNGAGNGIPYLQPSLFASPKPAGAPPGGRNGSDPPTPTTSNSGAAAAGRPSSQTPGRSGVLGSPKLGASAYNPTSITTPTRKNSGGMLGSTAPAGALNGLARTGSGPPGPSPGSFSGAAAAAAGLSVIGAARGGLNATFPSATGGSRPPTAGGAALLSTTGGGGTGRPATGNGVAPLGRTGSGVPGFSFTVGSNQSMGSRGYQEDYRAIVDTTSTPGGHANLPNVLLGAAVYDGHGGRQVSHWLASSYCMLNRAMEAVQSLVSSGGSPNDVSGVLEDVFMATGAAAAAGRMTAGSCVAMALLVAAGPTGGGGGLPWVLSANVGDSRTVLVSWDEPGEGGGGGGLRLEATQLSVDHKLGPAKSSEETRRVQAAGGTVIQLFGTWRIDGSLAVARAIGDCDFARYVTSKPTVQVRQLMRRDRWIIIASDGLWDVMTNEEVASFCRSQNSLSSARMAEALVREAVRNRGSGDNTTVVAIRLNAAGAPASSSPSLQSPNQQHHLMATA
ncbi:hypothetical protein GPECTOR_12g599 [Gonium pectorale]|uniref:PPM-type phosphatase domain-containing protein n=1 Tax=Gonium pectorale TaxID=33097 RepID=A0A150GPB5_GONPE|nr:hypothetical protein GPECTOR_12g599 [Gonium pectorale]|eukprot:KXZ51635.1 hypothetical protein GPECTOR_12g599 [Gonium pectorale]